ncbi:MAG: response regulator [Saprospiraceae bacterium]|nr:response regulator [Saprospiraceae bacterium]
MSIPTILVIDDQATDRLIYRRFLGEHYYRFLELNSGAQVLEYLSENTIDLILLDWQMPKVDGLETLKAIRRGPDYTHIPIIVITGKDDSESLELAFNFGCTDYIRKPVDKIELAARVQNVMELNKSQETLIQQSKELLRLYKIIQDQKYTLEESLGFKRAAIEAHEEKITAEKEILERDIKTLSLQISKTINHVRQIKQVVQELLNAANKNGQHESIIDGLKTVEKSINKIISNNQSNLEVKRIIEISDKDLNRKLLSINPKLTNLELRHCNYLNMNLSNHEIADIMNVELKSLQMSRYRIKKKLQIESDKTLREFILSI